MARVVAALAATGVLVLAACGSSSGDSATATPAAAATTPAARASGVKTIATGLHVPWGIAFLPSGDALVSERTTGDILQIPKGGGTPRKVMHLPEVNTNAGEGGLLGIAVSPDYANDSLVYAYYTTDHDNRIVRFKLGGAEQPLLTGIAAGVIHNGGRIAFGPEGKLYAGVGETGQSGLSQDRTALNGKILRINPDGTVPDDNPFPGSPVWTLGHRNVQGLAWDSAGRLWSSEFGQNTWDEVNLIRKGRNYGWPIVEGKGDTQGGKLTNPLVIWRTSEASPSGDAVIGNKLFVAALGGRALWRIQIKGAKLGKPTKLYLDRWGRLRTVAKAPDGSLWIATSNTDGRGAPRPGDDRIVSITP